MLGGENILCVHPGKIVVSGVERTDMIKAEISVSRRAIPPWPRRFSGRTKFASSRASGLRAKLRRACNAAMKTGVSLAIRHRS
jgi:hypothetical protein